MSTETYYHGNYCCSIVALKSWNLVLRLWIFQPGGILTLLNSSTGILTFTTWLSQKGYWLLLLSHMFENIQAMCSLKSSNIYLEWIFIVKHILSNGLTVAAWNLVCILWTLLWLSMESFPSSPSGRLYWIRGGTLFDLLLHLKPQCCSCCPSPLFPALPWLFPQNFKVLTNGNSMNCFYPFFNCNFQLNFWKFCRQVTMKRRQTLDLTTHKYRTLGTASEVSVKLSKNQLKNVFF